MGVVSAAAPVKGAKAQQASDNVAATAGAGVVEESGEPAEPITFSGVWMAGKEEDWERRFPVAMKVAMVRRTQEAGFSESFDLANSMLQAFQASKREGGRRVVDGLTTSMGTARDGRALVMACVINHEYTHSRTVGAGKGAVRTVFADVFADLVICDFSDLSVVARIPFRVTRKDAVKSGKTDADAGMQLLRDIYAVPPADDFVMGGEKHRGLTYWTERQAPLRDNGSEKGVQLPIHLITGMLNASKYGFKMLGFSKVVVRGVNVMPDAEAVLHPYFKPFKEEYFASLFTSNFFDGTGLATLPYSKGNEVVFSMMVEELADAQQVKLRSGREAESRNVKFALARADYDIDLVIPTFMTVPRGDIAQCCAYSRITVKQNEAPIYSVQHDANQQMIVTRGSKGASWEAYADATCEMFFRAGPQMLKAIAGRDVQEAKPVKVIKPTPLRQFFLSCAPETIMKK